MLAGMKQRDQQIAALETRLAAQEVLKDQPATPVKPEEEDIYAGYNDEQLDQLEIMWGEKLYRAGEEEGSEEDRTRAQGALGDIKKIKRERAKESGRAELRVQHEKDQKAAGVETEKGINQKMIDLLPELQDTEYEMAPNIQNAINAYFKDSPEKTYAGTAMAFGDRILAVLANEETSATVKAGILSIMGISRKPETPAELKKEEAKPNVIPSLGVPKTRRAVKEPVSTESEKTDKENKAFETFRNSDGSGASLAASIRQMI